MRSYGLMPPRPVTVNEPSLRAPIILSGFMSVIWSADSTNWQRRATSSPNRAVDVYERPRCQLKDYSFRRDHVLAFVTFFGFRLFLASAFSVVYQPSRIQFSVYNPSCSFVSVTSNARTVSGGHVSTFSPRNSGPFRDPPRERARHPNIFAKPVRERDGTLEDGVAITMTEETRDRCARPPRLLLFRRII